MNNIVIQLSHLAVADLFDTVSTGNYSSRRLQGDPAVANRKGHVYFYR